MGVTKGDTRSLDYGSCSLLSEAICGPIPCCAPGSLAGIKPKQVLGF